MRDRQAQQLGVVIARLALVTQLLRRTFERLQSALHRPVLGALLPMVQAAAVDVEGDQDRPDPIGLGGCLGPRQCLGGILAGEKLVVSPWTATPSSRATSSRSLLKSRLRHCAAISPQVASSTIGPPVSIVGISRS